MVSLGLGLFSTSKRETYEILGDYSTFNPLSINGESYTVLFIGTHQQMPKHIKEVLFKPIYNVAMDAFGQRNTKPFHNDVYNHIFNSQHLLLIFDSKYKCVGFQMYDILGDILYLAGACVLHSHQGMGIGSKLIQFAASGRPIRYIVMRTQNAGMKACFDKSIGAESYPKKLRQTPSHIVKACQVVAHHIGDYNMNTDTLVSRGAYGGSLYGKNHLVHKVGTLRDLDVNAGDTMYCGWHV